MYARPRTITFFASLLDKCSSTKSLQKLKQIHAKTILLNISSHSFLRTKLVSAYASCSQMREAHILFFFTSRQPTFLYNSIIRAHSSLNQSSQSLAVFHHMISAQKPFDIFTLPPVLKSCGQLSDLTLGRELHGAVLVNGYSSNLANNNSLISMYGKCGELDCAMKLFDEMPVRSYVSYSALMVGYEKLGMAMEVFILFDKMVEMGMVVDEVTLTTVLTTCSREGMVEKGKEVFEKMEESFGVKPKLEHYTCMVDMLGKAGLVEEAEELVMGMELETDMALWNALLTACRVHGKVEVAGRVERRLVGRS
ncbi:pentatricopeptide repeat-containing protein [Hibiscus syriacus]|uniref:Pentatricopeptide repeat-containing protein n=1 Tax=Hibiscus syriacus TaxID=106335 RepID=A0A6A2YW68_HIBSY|nr:putative pentatricopeptide repeat-containing protein At1g68930 [Hibiscus syriacus]KAE8683678.1 pentatricopeptide repeat-containing protein [Hibiscus syriacus]